MNLADILKDSNYKLSQFTKAEIEQLEQRGSTNEIDEATATAWINQQLEALGINLSNS
ncbi:MAG: hypothetical protein V7L27_08855 [Nostoc sp.]|uniref:hypothetical protein n=1 Tax=Nostoc sp. TaxID=1180 RepID=UPI002FF65BDA